METLTVMAIRPSQFLCEYATRLMATLLVMGSAAIGGPIPNGPIPDGPVQNGPVESRPINNTSAIPGATDRGGNGRAADTSPEWIPLPPVEGGTPEASAPIRHPSVSLAVLRPVSGSETDEASVRSAGGSVVADDRAESSDVDVAETISPFIAQPLITADDRLQAIPGERADRPFVAAGRNRYHMDILLETQRRRVQVAETVTWTNPGTVSTDRLVFQVPSNHTLSEKMIAAGERTVESLRLEPEGSIDYEGHRFHLTAATVEGERVRAWFDPQHDTHLSVQLPAPVAPGESVSVELSFWIDIPPIMGRMGQYRGVTNLLNWYPVLAFYSGESWEPVPYIPWHQPWFNEVGDYTVKLRLPADQKVVSGGHVVQRSQESNGYQTLQIRGEGLRDFTLICSSELSVVQGNANGTPIRVLYLPGHRDHAEVALQTAEESIRLYEQWFGPYPYREFELTESYFGWNGNESSGVVMVDARIFDTPKYAARYVEHLVSHEICHQWWYSSVGTDGYHEPWMDEGLVTWFTRLKMEEKYGPDVEVLEFPGYGPFQFPNIQYRSLVHSGYDAYRSRGGEGIANGTLDDVGHLHNLFSLVYDKGARVTGMIQKRMGRDRFLQFMKYLYGRYRYRILRVADFRRELEAWTGEDWDPFFETWLESNVQPDWSLSDVEVRKTDNGYVTEAVVTQSQPVAADLDLEVQFGEEADTLRIPSLQAAMSQATEGVRVTRRSDREWLVSLSSPHEPSQMTLDPGGYLVDVDPYNNSWRPSYQVRVSPFYTPVDEASLMQPWNQHGLVAGFGIDQDGRIGLRASAIAGNRYRISPFIAYTAATATRNDDHLSAGIDAIFYNVPNSNWQLLARYEHALLSTLANDPGHQARIALRRVINYTTSLIYPNLSYVDIYTRFGDNFFPDEDNTINPDPRIEQYDNVRAFGIDYHADSQLPYWNPDRGMKIDANYEHGFQAFGGGASYDRISGQLSVVQRLSVVDGWLGRTRVAGRIAGGYGWDDNGEHFRFGGPGRFRGREAVATEGNAFWLSSLEWRFPVINDLDLEVLDNTAALHSVDGSLFYDVGRSYLLDQPQGKTDHAVGVGLYWQIPLLSLVENLTVRTEYGSSATNETGAFWFGLYRAF